MDIAERMKKQRMIKRTDSSTEKPYEVVKRGLHHYWNEHGRKHTEKGIATFYHQNQIHPEYEIFTESSELKTEIESLVREHITAKPANLSKLEQIA